MNQLYFAMATMQAFFNDRFDGRKDRGATAVEYGLMVGLIAVVIIAAVIALGGNLNTIFDGVGTSVGSVADEAGAVAGD